MSNETKLFQSKKKDREKIFKDKLKDKESKLDNQYGRIEVIDSTEESYWERLKTKGVQPDPHVSAPPASDGDLYVPHRKMVAPPYSGGVPLVNGYYTDQFSATDLERKTNLKQGLDGLVLVILIKNDESEELVCQMQYTSYRNYNKFLNKRDKSESDLNNVFRWVVSNQAENASSLNIEDSKKTNYRNIYIFNIQCYKQGYCTLLFYKFYSETLFKINQNPNNFFDSTIIMDIDTEYLSACLCYVRSAKSYDFEVDLYNKKGELVENCNDLQFLGMNKYRGLIIIKQKKNTVYRSPLDKLALVSTIVGVPTAVYLGGKLLDLYGGKKKKSKRKFIKRKKSYNIKRTKRKKLSKPKRSRKKLRSKRKTRAGMEN